MKVVEFPNKIKKKKCDCMYVYRIIFNPDDQLFGVMIGNNYCGDDVEVMTSLTGFEYENEAEAAAFGFLEALHYIKIGGKL